MTQRPEKTDRHASNIITLTRCPHRQYSRQLCHHAISIQWLNFALSMRQQRILGITFNPADTKRRHGIPCFPIAADELHKHAGSYATAEERSDVVGIPGIQ